MHLPAYEDGADRVFRNVGIYNSDAGESPKRKHTTFKTWRKFEIMNPIAVNNNNNNNNNNYKFITVVFLTIVQLLELIMCNFFNTLTLRLPD